MTRQHQQTLNQSERLAWLRLIRSENVGPVTFYHLVRYYGSAQAALDALPELAKRAGKRKIRVCSEADASREMAAVDALGAHIVAHGEPDYPVALAAIEDPPPIIVLKGDPAVFGQPIVAMVGARNASGNGKRLAHNLALALGEAGLTVASGLARGIDTAAHQGALATGTIAVVAGGIDVPYPEENTKLHHEIASRGMVLAESPLGVNPTARHFPRRNRLISGLAVGVIVVEAAQRSGSLITARMALEQGREVFAVPGSPLDPRARGTNNLIRDGATLTETVDDVLRVVTDQIQRRSDPDSPPPTPVGATGGSAEDDVDDARKIVLESLSPTPSPVDELVRECQLSAAVVAVVLFELELAGRIERHPGGQVSLRIA